MVVASVMFFQSDRAVMTLEMHVHLLEAKYKCCTSQQVFVMYSLGYSVLNICPIH